MPIREPAQPKRRSVRDGQAVGFLSTYVFKGRSVRDAIPRGQIVARHTCGQRASSSNPMTANQLEREVEFVPNK